MTRTFDLLDWLLPKAERFPRLYRTTVTQRLMDAALDFQKALFQAQSLAGSNRQTQLRRADAALNSVRLYLRLIHRWRWLNDGQYRHVSPTAESMLKAFEWLSLNEIELDGTKHRCLSPLSATQQRISELLDFPVTIYLALTRQFGELGSEISEP